MGTGKLNPKTQQKIIQALEQGHYDKTAYTLAGIGKETFYGWLRKGRTARSGRYKDFSDAVKKARERAVDVWLSPVREACLAGNWTACAWYLERTRPQKFGKMQRVEMKHEGKLTKEATLSDDAKKILADPELRKTASRLLTELEGSGRASDSDETGDKRHE